MLAQGRICPWRAAPGSSCGPLAKRGRWDRAGKIAETAQPTNRKRTRTVMPSDPNTEAVPRRIASRDHGSLLQGAAREQAAADDDDRPSRRAVRARLRAGQGIDCRRSARGDHRRNRGRAIRRPHDRVTWAGHARRPTSHGDRRSGAGQRDDRGARTLRLSACCVRDAYPDLDDEALAMIQRASPLPPVPLEICEQIVQLVVPVRFRMSPLRRRQRSYWKGAWVETDVTLRCGDLPYIRTYEQQTRRCSRKIARLRKFGQ